MEKYEGYLNQILKDNETKLNRVVNKYNNLKWWVLGSGIAILLSIVVAYKFL